MSKISVIIPVYATEQYLERCLDSVVNQTLTDIEILCVYDPYPDASLEILNRYAQHDERIKVIQQSTNLGLGGARNTAIRLATAPYLASVDSDDYIVPHMLETLWNATENQTVDVVIFGFDKVDPVGNVLETVKSINKTYYNNNNEIDIFFLTQHAFWNKLWRTELYTANNIYFPNHIAVEDLVTTPRILAYSKTIKKINAVLYKYVQRSDSMSKASSYHFLGSQLYAFGILYNFLHDNNLLHRYGEDLKKKMGDLFTYRANAALASQIPDDEKDTFIKQLLLIRMAFMEYYEHVRGMDAQAAVPLLRSANSKLDIQKAHKENIPVSLVVKTFLRPEKLKNFLFSVGEYETTHGVHFPEVLVGDDSPEEVQAHNEQVIHAAREKYPHLSITHCKYEFNIGLGAGRNRLTQASTQPFILVCEDDFLLDPECDFRIPLSELTEGGYDLIGGWLKNRYDIPTGNFVYGGGLGKFVFLPKEWIAYRNSNEDDMPDLAPADFLDNFYILKREMLNDIRWSDEQKMSEHRAFFRQIYQHRYKAVFSKNMFVKHNMHAVAKDNQDYFKMRRGERNRYYIFKCIADAGFEKFTEYAYCKNELKKLEIDVVRQKLTETVISYKEPVLAQKVPVTRLTPKYRNYSFGYFDVKANSPDGRYTLCQSVPAMDRLPVSTDIAQLCYIDNEHPGEVTEFASTTAWCHQQGAHLQFVGDSTSCIFNTFDEEKQQFHSCLFDLKTGNSRFFPRPISAVSPDGKMVASLNFSRLYDFRPGYGYGHIPDMFAEEAAPLEDGLYLLDLETGETWLELNYQTLRDFVAPDESSNHRNEKWVINHAAFSPSGEEILLLARTLDKHKSYPTYTLVYNIKTKKLHKIFGLSSHYHWKDNETILLSGSPFMEQPGLQQYGVYEVGAHTPDYTPIAQGSFVGDGHCSYSPDRSLIVYDSYASSEFPYCKLQVFDVHAKRCLDLGYFFSEDNFFGGNRELRCDLHPRWSQDGKTLTFDSIHEGFRGVYAISVADIREAFASAISYFSEEELRRWYTAKYSQGKQGAGGQTPKAAAPQKPKSAPPKNTPLLHGSAEHVRRLLAYRFGEILTTKSGSLTGCLNMPFALLKEYSRYRKEEKQHDSPLPVLTDFADAHEGRALSRTVTYKVGKAFVDNITSPVGWFRLPGALKKASREG